MDVAGLSDDRGTRSAAGHRPRGTSGRRPPSTAVRPQPPASAAETADRLQADYFLRMLAQRRHHVDHRIAGYHKAIAQAEAAGDAEGVSAMRRKVRAEVRDRQTLDGLVEKLHRRFPRRERPVVH